MTDTKPTQPALQAQAAKAPAAKAPAAKAIATVTNAAEKAVDATTGAAREIARQTAEGIEANPVGVLAGGIALGVLAGAFVPRGAREARLLHPVGKRLADTARGAIDAAKDTAKSEFDVLGLTRNAARDQVGKLIGEVLKALAVAGTAAIAAAKAPPPAPEKTASKKAASTE